MCPDTMEQPRLKETGLGYTPWLRTRPCQFDMEGRSQPSATCYSRKADHGHELAFTRCESVSMIVSMTDPPSNDSKLWPVG